MRRLSIFFVGMWLMSLTSIFGAIETQRYTPIRTIRVGMFPMEGYHNYKGEQPVGGYGYDYLHHLRNYTTWNYQYTPKDKHWPEMLDMLSAGTIDLVSSVHKTPEREEKFAFSKHPIGYSSTILTTRAKDARFQHGDYNAWRGIRIGMLKNSTQNKRFSDFAANKKIQWTAVYYDSGEKMRRDMLAGVGIDAIVTSNLRITRDERILESLGSTPFYIAVRKSNSELLAELNAAQDQLIAAQPTLPNVLWQRYYALPVGETIGFTIQERTFIQAMKESGQVFTAVLNPDRSPLSFIKDNVPHGIFADITAEIIRRTGLTIHLRPTTTREAYRTAYGDPTVDFILDLKQDFSEAERMHFRLSSPYYNSQTVILHRKASTPKYRSFATVDFSNMPEPVKQQFAPDIRIHTYETLGQATHAVASGICDATYLHIKAAEHALISDVTGSLAIQHMPALTTSYCIGMHNTLNPLIFSIVEKAVASLDRDFINQMIFQYDAQIVPGDVLQRAIYQHPWLFIGSLTLLFLMATSFLVFVLVQRKKERRVYREKAHLLADVQMLNDCLVGLMQTSDLHVALRHILAMLATRFGATHAFILRFDSTPANHATVIGVFTAPNSQAGLELDTTIPCSDADAWYQQLAAHNDILVNDAPHNPNASVIENAQRLVSVWSGDTLDACIGMMVDDASCTLHAGENENTILLAASHFIELLLARHTIHLALLSAIDKAQAAEKAKSLFLATMSHEIRTPLNAVIGFADLLQDPSLTEAVRLDYLQGITTAGNALLSLINDVLDLSKLEAGSMVFTPSVTRFDSVLRATASVFQQKCDAKSIELICDVANDFPAVFIDKLRIRQILFNLLGNAVKFTDVGSITLRATFTPENATTGTLTLHVIDTGIGIDEAEQVSIFQLFVQSNTLRGTAAAHSGTGLGLALCQRLAEKMNGHISLSSTRGKGSDFCVTFQNVAWQNVLSENVTNINNTPTNNEQFTDISVLLVDDIPLNLKVAAAILSRLGVTAETAANANEAWAKLNETSFDFVLTDLWMPGMNGAELAAKIRHQPRFLSTIIIALSADTDIGKNFDAAVFDDVLAKPITLASVSAMLHRHAPVR